MKILLPVTVPGKADDKDSKSWNWKRRLANASFAFWSIVTMSMCDLSLM